MSEPETPVRKRKVGGGRRKVFTPSTNKKRIKSSKQDYATSTTRITLKHETKEWLDSFQKVHECKSYNEVIELLLQQHPETPIQPKVAQVQRDISPVMGPVVPPNFQRDNKDSALQMVCVAGLVGECAVLGSRIRQSCLFRKDKVGFYHSGNNRFWFAIKCIQA